MMTSAALEFQRNVERYQVLRWAQHAFNNFKVVPPDTGICHQVNLEYLPRVVFTREGPPWVRIVVASIGSEIERR